MKKDAFRIRTHPSLLIYIFLFYLSSTILCKSQNIPENQIRVKIAAVQISGYDKTVSPGLSLRVVESAVSYINKAGCDTAQLVVFPEYYLGRVSVPGEETRLISEAAAREQD